MRERGPVAGEGAIQPIGFLVALAPDWRVSTVSANIADFLSLDPASVLGQPITSLFDSDAVHSLRNRLALLRTPHSVERLFNVALTGGEHLYDVALHMSGTTVVIEAEPSRDHHHDRDSTGTVRGMIAQLEAIDDLSAFFTAAARQVRALTGFDRVIIQRLGSDQPAGEAVRSGAPSATTLSGDEAMADESRMLGFVADTAAEPVALSTLTRACSTLDLSHATLCAAPPTQLEALRADGVGAAILLPLNIAGRCWGAISCVHRAPSCPSVERRSALEWFAMMLAMQIEIRELRARLGDDA